MPLWHCTGELKDTCRAPVLPQCVPADGNYLDPILASGPRLRCLRLSLLTGGKTRRQELLSANRATSGANRRKWPPLKRRQCVFRPSSPRENRRQQSGAATIRPRDPPAQGPTCIVCGFRTRRDAEIEVVCVSETPVCAYSGQQEGKPQTSALVCGFFGLPEAATANNAHAC